MTISAFPTPTPTRTQDPEVFDQAMAAFLDHFPTFVTEANAAAVSVNADEVAAAASAGAADASETAAAASAGAAAASALSAAGAAGAAAWVSGTTYSAGTVVYSPINFLSYRRTIAGAGTTDPSADAVNWTKIVPDTQLRNAYQQAVAMTAATSDSNGITVADAAVLDCGTTGFTPIWNGALPDYTPAAEVIIVRKHDGTNGFMLSVMTTGLVRLNINTSNYYSTATVASLGVTDGNYIEVAIAIARETAAAAGSIIFALNGVQLGSAVAITAGAPVTVDNINMLYVLGTGTVRTAGICRSAHLYNRALTAAGMLAHYLNGVGESDKWASNSALYTSDFSAGVDSFTVAAGCTVDGNIDAIGGLNDWIRLTVDSVTSTHAIRRVISGLNTRSSRARLILTYYIPSGQTLDGIAVRSYGGTGITGATSLMTTKDVATTVEYSLDVTSNLSGLSFYGVDSLGNTTFLGNGSDVFYIKALVATKTGAVLALESSGIQPNQWHDSSTNEQHATYPTAGASLTQWKETGLYHWTVAITADTTLTSIVPAGYELEKILFKNSTAGAVSVRLGTTASGTEIFGLTALNTSATFGGHKTIVINQGFSLTAEQTLYLSSTDWTGGGTAPSLTFTAYFRRIS